MELRHPNRKLGAEEITSLVDSSTDGAHIRGLARRFGMHEQTVKATLRRAGVELRPWPMLDDEHVDVAAVLYGGGWSLAQLGDRFGCDASTMRRTLHRAGVPTRPRGRSSTASSPGGRAPIDDPT